MSLKGLEVKEEKIIPVKKPKSFSYTTEYFQKRKAQMDNVFNQRRPDLQELSEFFAPRMSRFLVTDINKP